MTLTDLVNELGNESAKVQLLESSVIRMKKNKKHGDEEITFATEQSLLDGGKTALVVWYDKSEFNEALSKLKEQQND